MGGSLELFPMLVWPCGREGSMEGRWRHRVGRRLGTCLAGPAQSGFVPAGGGGTRRSACPNTSVSVGMGGPGPCGRTKGNGEAGTPVPTLPAALAASGQAGPQGCGCPVASG